MNSKRKRKPRKPTATRLFETAIELRALAYLVESQGKGISDIVPTDIEEIHYGLGMVLSRLARRVRRVAREADETTHVQED